MESIKEKKESLWWRNNYLQIVVVALKSFEWSKDEKLMEYAKYFGKESEKLKIKLQNLNGK